MKLGLIARTSAIALAASMAAPSIAYAQSAVDALRDTIVVTATKKADAENVQEVPLAVTAYGAAQLDALKVRDLGSLSYSTPNVGLEDIGTTRGVANFSIRGIGVNSSIPSIDPAVGTFVDGVYLGQNAGVVLDIFDLESIEVLRGPQGILFGRNVTGGAVLINTKRPNLEEFEASFKTAAESGLRGTGNNYYLMGSVSGPLVKDVLGLKLSAYYNNDRGYHKRYLGGPNLPAVAAASPLAALAGLIAQSRPDAFADHGKAETWVIRPQLLWRPTENVEVLLRYEHFESKGDGPSSQNHPGFIQPPHNPMTMTTPAPIPFANFLFSSVKDSFDFSIDEPGMYEATADSISSEINIDVAFGDGTITNIFGWRDTLDLSYGDIDGTPFHLFHSGAINDFEQISNEIRYSGRFFDRMDFTTGFYYYSADHIYQENRDILGGFRTLQGGGIQDSRNFGIFAQADFDLTDQLTFTAGGRYSNEKKAVSLTNISTNSVVPCSIAMGTCDIHFVDNDKWTSFTPKIGLRYAASDTFNIYAHWTQGVRSGGYNFRNTSVVFPIAGFDQEKVNSYEIGFKAQPADGRATLNAAVFYTDISDMQREINLSDAFAGVVQLIRNTADAHIWGFELEGQFAVTDNFLLRGNVGHLDGTYDTVLFDLSSDGIVNDDDLALAIPRLAPWTYSAGFVFSQPLGSNSVDLLFNYSHRDDNAYTDNNLGILQGADMIDASIAFNLGDNLTISLYGQNLLHEVTHGGETQLPTTIGGGSFAPLNKGRVVGVELQVDL